MNIIINYYILLQIIMKYCMCLYAFALEFGKWLFYNYTRIIIRKSTADEKVVLFFVPASLNLPGLWAFLL